VKVIGAAALAIAVLWIADIELNGGRYSHAIERALATAFGR